MLLKIHTRLRHYFPEGPLYLEVAPNRHDNNQLRLVISLYPNDTATDTLVKFSQFKDNWWFDKYDELGEKFAIFVEHKAFASSGDPWDSIEKLVGSVEGPEDWSIEHDHYIYSTSKRNQKN
jgi:hypothetical protein